MIVLSFLKKTLLTNAFLDAFGIELVETMEIMDYTPPTEWT